MPKQRAAAPLFSHVTLCFSQRLIFSCGNGVSFLIPSLRFIFKAFCIRFHYTCSLHVPSMFLNPVGFLVNPIVKDKWRSAIYINKKPAAKQLWVNDVSSLGTPHAVGATSLETFGHLSGTAQESFRNLSESFGYNINPNSEHFEMETSRKLQHRRTPLRRTLYFAACH